MTSSKTAFAQALDAPGCATGKRSRSNSSSTCSSPSSSSASGSSIFSRHHSAESDDNSSSCSSPSSSKTSPASSSNLSDDERPCKSIRTSRRSVGPIQQDQTAEDATLATLKSKCTLGHNSIAAAPGFLQSATPSPPESGAAGNGGKTLFVDCLVDATVHVLDMIWHAPVRKSIAFLQNVRSASSVCTGEITRPCRCPVGAPFTGGIPLDLFVRETLRRSRTSCSTLQAALLYCKRVGAEAIRKRAESEEVELTEEERKILDGHSRCYPSLSKRLDKNCEDSFPPGITADPILCSRRTFLAAVMTSSKFLQDRTFSNRAWSKISGLNVRELGLVERRMLDAIEFDLYVSDEEWQSWTNYLKGDWKASIECCRCQSSTVATSQQSLEGSTIRKVLERTSSLRADEALDMECHILQSVATTSPQLTSIESSSNLATPTQALQTEVNRTPTKSFAHRRDQSLLPFALSNSVAINTTIDVDSNADLSAAVSVPAPFPMRKGLAMRSVSSQ